MSTINPTSAAEAESLATAKDALGEEQRARRAAGCYLPPEADGYDSKRDGCLEQDDDCEFKYNDNSELGAAEPESNSQRFKAKPDFKGGRGRGTGPDDVLTVAS